MEYICANCIDDLELKSYISSLDKKSNCDCCSSQNVSVIKLEELYDFFQGVFNCLIGNENSLRNIIDLLEEDWSFFSDNIVAEKILSSIIHSCPSHIDSTKMKVDYAIDIYDNISYWTTLKEKLKTQSRYITDISALTELGWDGFFNTKAILVEGQKLYRARIHHSIQGAYEKSKMFGPPANMATAGRANPMGISYLYLSDNEVTVLHEVRATLHDELSLGTFVKASTCKSDIKLADFTERSYLYPIDDLSTKIKSTLLKKMISKDLSKPIRRYDSELDYIPTQFICEFIKLQAGVQGVKFYSSLHDNGINFVLFEQDLVDCINVKKVRVTEKMITSELAT